jgi:uncharacterized cupin superfamily protein
VRDAKLSVIQERMPSNASEVRHRHAQARQFFFVLTGELTLEVAGIFYPLPAGTGLEIAPGVAHQALNRSAAAVEFLVVSHPPSHGDRQLDT